jgi:hypothetical protein
MSRTKCNTEGCCKHGLSKSKCPRCYVVIHNRDIEHTVRRKGFGALSKSFKLLLAKANTNNHLIMRTNPSVLGCVASLARGNPLAVEDVSHSMVVHLAYMIAEYQVEPQSPLHKYVLSCIEYLSNQPSSFSHLCRTLEAIKFSDPSSVKEFITDIFIHYPLGHNFEKMVQLGRRKDNYSKCICTIYICLSMIYD